MLSSCSRTQVSGDPATADEAPLIAMLTRDAMSRITEQWRDSDGLTLRVRQGTTDQIYVIRRETDGALTLYHDRAGAWLPIASKDAARVRE